MRFKKLIVLFSLALPSLLGCQKTSYFKGSGIQEDPYIISNAEELFYLANLSAFNVSNVANSYIKLVNDIDLNNRIITPVCPNSNYSFKGHFDGDNHLIEGFNPNMTFYNIGLFGAIGSEGIVENVNISIDWTSSKVGNYMGSIAGVIEEGGTVSNCHATGSISGHLLTTDIAPYDNLDVFSEYVHTPTIIGGIAGENGGDIINCSSSVDISADITGGIAGMSRGNITSSKCDNVSLYGRTAVGGVIGYARFGNMIEHCEANNCELSSKFAAGGFIGVSRGKSVIKYSQASGIIDFTSSDSKSVFGANILGSFVTKDEHNITFDSNYNVVGVTHSISSFVYRLNDTSRSYIGLPWTKVIYHRCSTYNTAEFIKLTTKATVQTETEHNIYVSSDSIVEIEGAELDTSTNKATIAACLEVDESAIEDLVIDNLKTYYINGL